MTPESAHEPWLVIIFGSLLGLAWTDHDIGAGFTTDSALFEQVADTDISGFYDRVYQPDGSFVGVQIAPVAYATLAHDLPDLPYVRPDLEGLVLQVLFRAAPTDLTVVSDQAFGGRIYQSLEGTFALSLDTFFLSDDERLTFAASPAVWVAVRSIED